MRKLSLIIITLALFIYSISSVFAQELVRFDFKVKSNQTNTCITNTTTVSKDTSSAPEGQASSTTQIGSPTTDCFASSGTPIGWPTHGWLTQGPKGAFDHIRISNPSVDIADFPNDASPPIYSTFNGKVVESYNCATYGTCSSSYGSHVILGDESNSFTVMFGHFAVLNVATGDKVNRGTTLGIMGTTGYSTGIHTHMEFRNVPGGLAPPNIPEPIVPDNCDAPSIPCSPFEVYFDSSLSPPTPTQTPTDNYWFLLDRLNKKEYLFQGPVGVRDRKYLVREFTVLPGLSGQTPTPVPSKVTPTREYWTFNSATLKSPVGDISNGGQPGFLKLDIPYDNSLGGPVPYLECGPSGTSQCNWNTPGAFGLHGVDNNHPLTDPGSSGCIRHNNTDIQYLYNLLSNVVNNNPNTIRYYIEDGVSI